MKVHLGSDHGGYALKEKIKGWLEEWAHSTHSVNSGQAHSVNSGQASLGEWYTVEDHGAYTLNPGDDYPDFVMPAAKAVALRQAQGHDDLGIVLGRSGNGEAIAANKVRGVRAAVCLNKEMARKAREHNDANVLSIGADYIDEHRAQEMVKTFLETPFSKDERYVRRIEKIRAVES